MWAEIQAEIVMLVTSTPPAAWPAGMEFRECLPGTAVGSRWNGTEFVAPTRAVVVPAEVPNASARRVLQQRFIPDGQSYFSVVQAFLQNQVATTAQLADSDPQKVAALGAWTQWDMGNYFERTNPLIEAMADIVRAAGGTVDVDELFVAANAI